MARKTGKTNTRRPDGTFAPGNPGGPGRPPRATEREYLKTIMNACPPDTWAEIVARAVADAKNGDGQARAWLASYLVGKPSPNHTAPRPSRLLAQEAAGSDPVAEEAAQLERDRKIADMFNF